MKLPKDLSQIDTNNLGEFISIYLLLLLTIGDIFLFIYFLHYVTQSVKFETIIKRVYKITLHTLDEICVAESPQVYTPEETKGQTIYMPSSNYYQGFNNKELMEFACEHDGTIQFLQPAGAFLLKGSPLLIFYSSLQLSDKDLVKIFMPIDFYNGQPLEQNSYYGYHQLAEVAIKALSPGINDPETAVLSIHALSDLFLYRLNHFIPTIFKDKNSTIRIVTVELDFEQLFGECYNPIWNYGKDDMYIQNTLTVMLEQLKWADKAGNHAALFNIFLNKIKTKMAEKES